MKRPQRLVFLSGMILLAVTFLSLAIGSRLATAKPNVLYIVADDQRTDTIAALSGNTSISTPNLDALAASGFAMTNAYNFGSNSGAVCQPSRAMFLTGRTMWHVNTGNLSGTTTMPETFRNSGYTTFGTGKWHNGSSSFVRSFDQGEHIFFGGCTGCSSTSHTDNDAAKAVVFNTTVKNMNPNGTFISITPAEHGSTHNSTLFANATVDFITDHTATSSNPFFAYLSFTAPHDPRVSPEPYDSMYRDADGNPTVSLPVNFLPRHPIDQGDFTIRDEQLVSQPGGPWPRTEAAVQEEIADYYGMITHMDAEIGRVIQALRESGEFENTIIVFQADQGLAIGSHGLMGKQNPYEHSIKAPLILSGPGITHGNSDALVYLHDVFPTVANLTGVSIPAGVEGQSLAGVIGGTETEVHDAIFNTYKNYQKTLRRDDWKLIYYPHIDRLQLFNLADDPDEMSDLSGDSAYSMLINELAALMRGKQQEYDDPNLVNIPYQGLLGDVFPDGVIDVRDWFVYRDNFDEDLSGLAFLDAYFQGDMDGDLDNDIDDFSLFKEAFNAANGTGAFEEMLSAVPEPSAFVLLALFWLLVIPSRLSVTRQSLRYLPVLALAATTVGMMFHVAGATPLAPNDPSIAGNLSVWLRDSGNNFDTGTGTWADVSGNGNNALVAGGMPAGITYGVPHLVEINPSAGVFGTYDSIAGVVFSGNADDLLRATNINGGVSMDSLTTIIVYSSPQANDLQRPIGIGSLTNNGGALSDRDVVFNPADDGTVRFDWGQSGAGTLTRPVDQLYVRGSTLTLTGNPGEGVIYDYFDGTVNLNGVTKTPGNGGLPASEDALYVGDVRLGPTAGNAGTSPGTLNDLFVAEVIVYATALSQQQIGEIGEWLQENIAEYTFPRPTLQVNTDTGAVTITNKFSNPIDMDLYRISSPSSSLDPTGWNSIQDQGNVPGFPGGDGNGTGWEKLGTPDVDSLAEAFLHDSSVLNNGQSISLGSAFNTSSVEPEVNFEVRLATGEVLYSLVEYVAGGIINGDFDGSGTVDQGDLDLVLLNWDQIAPIPGWVNQVPGGAVGNTDLDRVRTNWGNTLAVAAASAVPEPSTGILLALAAILAGGGVRKK